MITQDFIIDDLKPTDANQLFQFMVDNKERLSQYFPRTLAGNSTLDASKEYITLKQKEIQDKSIFTFAIRKKTSDTIAGLIILKEIDWIKKRGEFAYCIGSAFEGKGVTTFAVWKMVGFAFDQQGLKTIRIIVHKSNSRSIKVALNNGFTWKKTLLKEFTPTNGQPLDMELYELTNER